MYHRSFAALAALSMLAGCASVTRGVSENVSITALPEDASIRTNLGHSCPRSPCMVEVSRKAALVAYADREGYKSGSVAIPTRMAAGGAAGLAGNILIGGVIGAGVDIATGATLEHWPNPATIVLEPVDAANPETPTYQAPPPPLHPTSMANKPVAQTKVLDPLGRG